MFKRAIVATTLLAVFGGGQPVFTEEAISEPGCVAITHAHTPWSQPTPRMRVGFA